MLVLKRLPEESLTIGENIIVKVLHVRDGVVRLGITAPKHIHIVRKELIEESVNDTSPTTN